MNLNALQFNPMHVPLTNLINAGILNIRDIALANRLT